MQGEVAVVPTAPGAPAAAPAEGLAPGVSVTVTVTNTSSTAAAPLVVDASPSPAARHLLQTASTATGLDVNVTITAPASDVSNITALVQQAVSSGQVQQELHQAGECCCSLAVPKLDLVLDNSLYEASRLWQLSF